MQSVTYDRLKDEFKYSLSQEQKQRLLEELTTAAPKSHSRRESQSFHKDNNSHSLSSAQSPKNIAAYLSMVNSFTSDDPYYLASDYFDSVERVAEMHNLADEVQLNIAKLRLRDKALNFARKGKLLDIDAYETFKDQIISRFQPFEDLESARARLINSVQLPNETVRSYENRIFLDIQESLPRDVTPTKREQLKELFEMQALSAFINGLHPDLAQFVRYKDPKSLTDAAYYAKLEERAIETRQRKLALINPNFLPDLSGIDLKPSVAKINYAGVDRTTHITASQRAADRQLADEYAEKNVMALAARQTHAAPPLLATRECTAALNNDTCGCHLKTFSTSFPGVVETRLCKNECPIHFSHQKSPAQQNFGAANTVQNSQYPPNDTENNHNINYNNRNSTYRNNNNYQNYNGYQNGYNNQGYNGYQNGINTQNKGNYRNNDSNQYQTQRNPSNNNYGKPYQNNNNNFNNNQSRPSGYINRRQNQNSSPYAGYRQNYGNNNISSGNNYRQKPNEDPSYPCLSCGEKGHIRSNCRFYTARCNNCSLMGHIARVCSKPIVNPGASRGANTHYADRLAAAITKLESLDFITTAPSTLTADTPAPKN